MIIIGRLSTCVLCGVKISKEEKKVHSNKPHCFKCYDLKVEENNQYNMLKDSICSYFQLPNITGLMMKQIKEFKDKFNYTYSGMNYCLWYLTSIKGMRLDPKYGIAMVKFEYENAKRYFEHQNLIEKSVNDVEFKEKIKIISIKKKENKTNKFLINLDDL